MTNRQQAALVIAVGGCLVVTAGAVIAVLVDPIVGVVVASSSIVEFGIAAWFWRRPV